MITRNTTINLQDDIRTSVLRARRVRMLRDLALVVPLVLFLLLMFAVPIAAFIYRAIDNSVLHRAFPMTHESLVEWAPGDDVPEAAYAALAADIRALDSPESVAVVARNLNNFMVGYRGLLMKAANRLPEAPPDHWRDAFTQIDKRWADPDVWSVLKFQTGPFTSNFLLSALDLKRDSQGDLARVEPDRRLYVPLLLRTFEISFMVAAICLVLGYPTAYVLVRLPPLLAGLAMVCVMLPFWTSLLVRTAAWIILLQGNGPANSFLMMIGAINQPLELIFNRFSTLVAMSHVLLPYMILPLYSSMKLVPANQMLAAHSLGANMRTAFLRVYLPQTTSGIAAGLLLVFILSLGYYITPALVGGPRDQMISYMITYHVNEVVNWSMASALGVLLLASTMILLLVMSRFVKLKQVLT